MKWYNIQNSINNLSISIDEEIGSFGVNAKDFIEEVQSNGSKNIELTINSGGGSVFEAFAIYDYLKTSNLNVNVKIVGVAASAASVLALAGDTLPTMTENSVIMIHNAWMPVISMQGMNSDEIRDYQEELEKDAKLMDSLNLKIAKIYSNATG
jgi:ATP-dependent Clp protease protease subunit